VRKILSLRDSFFISKNKYILVLFQISTLMPLFVESTREIKQCSGYSGIKYKAVVSKVKELKQNIKNESTTKRVQKLTCFKTQAK